MNPVRHLYLELKKLIHSGNAAIFARQIGEQSQTVDFLLSNNALGTLSHNIDRGLDESPEMTVIRYLLLNDSALYKCIEFYPDLPLFQYSLKLKRSLKGSLARYGSFYLPDAPVICLYQGAEGTSRCAKLSMIIASHELNPTPRSVMSMDKSGLMSLSGLIRVPPGLSGSSRVEAAYLAAQNSMGMSWGEAKTALSLQSSPRSARPGDVLVDEKKAYLATRFEFTPLEEFNGIDFHPIATG